MEMQLDTRKQFTIGGLLALIVAVTQGHHFATVVNLPPATWTAFFLAGFYVRRATMFFALLAEVVLIDYFAITVGGVSSFCVSPAYAFLLPSYGALWFCGRWYANRHQFNFTTLPALVGSLAVGVTLAEVFSSGGFYFFSGRFAETSLAEFGSRLMMYFPQTLQSFAFWVGVAVIVHVAFALTMGNTKRHA
jgi:hypothetical protein